MESKEQTKFELGDPVVDLETNKEGAISRLCPDPNIICIRWSEGGIQEMVETKTLKKRD